MANINKDRKAREDKKNSRKSSRNDKYSGQLMDADKVRPLFSILFFTCWMLCVCTAFGVVYSTFETRKSTQQLEELRREAADLNVISGQYLLEQSSLGAYSRVEKIASGKLSMVRPGPEHTVLVIR